MLDRMISRNHGERHPTNLVFVSAVPQFIESVKSSWSQTAVWHTGHMHACRMEGGKETRTIRQQLKTPHDFWSVLATRVGPQRPVWIFAHDLPHTFTLLGGWREWRQGNIGVEWNEIEWQWHGSTITPDKCKPGLIVDNDPPVVFDLWHAAGGRVVFVDTRNYYNQSMPDGLTAHQQCEHVRDLIIGLWTEHKRRALGNWSYTAAGIGWNSWRHRFMHHAVFIHGEHDIDQLERDAYYGGWQEIRFTGTVRKPLAQIDCNGLYPFIMGSRNVPVSLHITSRGRNADHAIVLREPERCIARVEIDTNTERFPVREFGTSTRMVAGCYQTVLCGAELARAIRTGCVKRVTQWACYNTRCIFNEFVQYWWAVRQQAKRDDNIAAGILAKAAMVGLYGRFARRLPKWTALRDDTVMPERWWSLDKTQMHVWRTLTANESGEQVKVCGTAVDSPKTIRLVGRHWQQRGPCERHPDSFPAIAAFITAAGREYMRMIAEQCGEKHVYRIATDSLIVDEPALHRLITLGMIGADKIGQFKIENTGQDAEFIGMHHFRLGDTWTRGGLSEQHETDEHGRLIGWQADRLDKLISSANSACFRRLGVVFTPAAGYNSASGQSGVWIDQKPFHEPKGTEHGRSETEGAEGTETDVDAGTT